MYKYAVGWSYTCAVLVYLHAVGCMLCVASAALHPLQIGLEVIEIVNRTQLLITVICVQAQFVSLQSYFACQVHYCFLYLGWYMCAFFVLLASCNAPHVVLACGGVVPWVELDPAKNGAGGPPDSHVAICWLLHHVVCVLGLVLNTSAICWLLHHVEYGGCVEVARHMRLSHVELLAHGRRR